MKAVVFDGQVRLAEDLPEPDPSPGEVRIRTLLAGICNTDLEIARGYAAFVGVLGHEFVGIVDQAQDHALVGRRVVGEINIPCGVCAECVRGRPTHCADRKALGIRGRNGCLAECFCLPERNLHLVPEKLPDEAAVFTEPLAAACEVAEQVHVRPTDRVVVLGDGKLGLLVAQVLALTGAELTVVGHHPDKLAILQAHGIPTQIARRPPALACGEHCELRRSEGPPNDADVVVECTGHPEGFETARRLVRPGGTLVMKSTYHGHVQTDLSGLVVDEIHAVGSRCGPFPAALRLLERGWVDVRSLITAEFPLHQALAAFEHAQQPSALKVLVRA